MPEREFQTNIFWTLEAIGEHVGSAGYAVRCERDGTRHSTGPEYHLDAIAEYQRDLWNRLSKMLPDEYRASGNAQDSPQ